MQSQPEDGEYDLDASLDENIDEGMQDDEADDGGIGIPIRLSPHAPSVEVSSEDGDLNPNESILLSINKGGAYKLRDSRYSYLTLKRPHLILSRLLACCI